MCSGWLIFIFKWIGDRGLCMLWLYCICNIIKTWRFPSYLQSVVSNSFLSRLSPITCLMLVHGNKANFHPSILPVIPFLFLWVILIYCVINILLSVPSLSQGKKYHSVHGHPNKARPLWKWTPIIQDCFNQKYKNSVFIG